MNAFPVCSPMLIIKWTYWVTNIDCWILSLVRWRNAWRKNRIMTRSENLSYCTRTFRVFSLPALNSSWLSTAAEHSVIILIGWLAVAPVDSCQKFCSLELVQRQAQIELFALCVMVCNWSLVSVASMSWILQTALVMKLLVLDSYTVDCVRVSNTASLMASIDSMWCDLRMWCKSV